MHWLILAMTHMIGNIRLFKDEVCILKFSTEMYIYAKSWNRVMPDQNALADFYLIQCIKVMGENMVIIFNFQFLN